MFACGKHEIFALQMLNTAFGGVKCVLLAHVSEVFRKRKTIFIKNNI